MAKKAETKSATETQRRRVANKQISLAPADVPRSREWEKVAQPGEGHAESESFFKRSHKVIVALTVQEILDEHIAKKLA